MLIIWPGREPKWYFSPAVCKNSITVCWLQTSPKQTWTNSPQSILSVVRLVGRLVCCVPLSVSSSPAFKFTGQRNPAEVPSLLRTYAKSCLIDCIIVKGEASDPCRIPSHQIRAINYTPVPPCLSKGSLPLCLHLPALVQRASSSLNAKLHQIRSFGVRLPGRQ